MGRCTHVHFSLAASARLNLTTTLAKESWCWRDWPWVSGVTGWRGQRSLSWSGRITRISNISIWPRGWSRIRPAGHSSLADSTSSSRTGRGPKTSSPMLSRACLGPQRGNLRTKPSFLKGWWSGFFLGVSSSEWRRLVEGCKCQGGARQAVCRCRLRCALKSFSGVMRPGWSAIQGFGERCLPSINASGGPHWPHISDSLCWPNPHAPNVSLCIVFLMVCFILFPSLPVHGHTLPLILSLGFPNRRVTLCFSLWWITFLRRFISFPCPSCLTRRRPPTWWWITSYPPWISGWRGFR